MAGRRKRRELPPGERPRLHVRKGDQVYVLSGEDKGKGPVEVLRVIPGRSQVVIRGVNMRWKHVRPSAQQPKGGRVQKEFPIHASKVLLYSEKAKKGVRVRRRVKDGRKIRVGTCGTEF